MFVFFFLQFKIRAQPRLDEDDRLSPILDHLSKNFESPDAVFSDGEGFVEGATINAGSIDHLSQYFPPCMRSLHMTLRRNHHLKHFGRLQYTLFLKGIGLSLDDCIIFWRQAFSGFTEQEFNSRYKYNVRHAYGDVGGDGNRRNGGSSPYSCQKILSETGPSVGQTHGCPYRHFSVDNLTTMLQSTGVNDREVLRGVREDVEKSRYHSACNRVFEWTYRGDIKKAKEEGTWTREDTQLIAHPNEYFKRGYLLRQNSKKPADEERG